MLRTIITMKLDSFIFHKGDKAVFQLIDYISLYNNVIIMCECTYKTNPNPCLKRMHKVKCECVAFITVDSVKHL